MDKRSYDAPVLRLIPLEYLEAFCTSGGAPDYETIDDFDWN